MTPRHLLLRVEQALTLARTSHCARRQFGAMLLDPERNVVIADAYNGGPRGGGRLCGGDVCLRDVECIPSGQRTEVGCHHAEANALCNASYSGRSTRGAWLLVTGEPCLACAKLIHHAGVDRVVCVAGGYAGGDAGPAYLREHGVEVTYVDGPRDGRGTHERARGA